MALKNKIDFALLASVNMANPNGDPLDDNRPRTNYDGRGEMSDVCIKRKTRNRLQDVGLDIFVQSTDRCDDGMLTLKDRAEANFGDCESSDEYIAAACNKYIDVRSFGQLFAYKPKNAKKSKKNATIDDDDESAVGVSRGIRGPVSIQQAVSVAPVEIRSMQITKSVNGEDPKTNSSRSSDTMGMKHFVVHGLYLIRGSINPQLAGLTGFDEEDAEFIKEALRTLFVNDSSAARPDGTMEVVRLYWWEHNCPVGQYSAAKVHRSLNVTVANGVVAPTSFDDYDVVLTVLPGLKCTVIDGL